MVSLTMFSSHQRFARQEFLSFSAAARLWMSGRQRCVCSSAMCLETYLMKTAGGMSWWCACSQMRPFTWRWWPSGLGFTSAPRRRSSISLTKADTRFWVSLQISPVLFHRGGGALFSVTWYKPSTHHYVEYSWKHHLLLECKAPWCLWEADTGCLLWKSDAFCSQVSYYVDIFIRFLM